MITPRPRGVVVIGATVMLVGTFLPWLRSGSVDRSSYDLIELVDRLGYASGGAMDLALTLWPIVPLLLVVSIIVAVTSRVPVAAVVALWTLTASYVGATAIALVAAPGASLLQVRYGVWVSVAGTLLVLAATVGESLQVIRRDRPIPRER